MRKSWLIATTLWLLLCSVPLGSLVAQQNSGSEETPTDEPQSPSTAVVPSSDQIVALIYSTLISLNQANMTGNYSVFRELGAPGFQVVNSSGQLAETFAELRSRNFDLSPVVHMHPKLIRAPAIEPNGMLRVTGFFETQPEQLNFDLIFQTVNDRWQLFGLGVNTAPVEGASPSAQPSDVKISKLPADQTPLNGAIEASTKSGAKSDTEANRSAAAPETGRGAEKLRIETEGAERTTGLEDKKNSFNPFAWFR